MAYLNCNKKQGYTLVEMVIVLGILSLFIFLSDTVYTNVRAANNLKIGTSSLIGAIRLAETNSQIGLNDSNWGVKILPSSVIVFKGSSYLSRDTTKDQSLDFPAGVIASGSSEFVFNKLSGWPGSLGVINLVNSSGNLNISINEKGTITY